MREPRSVPRPVDQLVPDLSELHRLAYDMRISDVQMIHRAGLGHVGGDLSAMDILAVLYFSILNVDPKHPMDPGRDRFILSKGHCSGALYTVLSYAGFFPREELTTYMQPLARLNGHPDRTKVPGVETNTGPLGHGLPVGVGAALGARSRKASWRTVVLVGDGELQEGSNWEAAMTASQHHLANLTVIIDRNGLQQGDAVSNTVEIDPLPEKWNSFGWRVLEVDGHDYGAIHEALSPAGPQATRPTCIIAHTHKGKGVSFMEDRAGWHHRVPSTEELELAVKELTEKRDHHEPRLP